MFPAGLVAVPLLPIVDRLSVLFSRFKFPKVVRSRVKPGLLFSAVAVVALLSTVGRDVVVVVLHIDSIVSALC